LSRPKIKSNIASIYGPAPSRRLGFSLGMDIIPFKTCSFNCIYCQLGPTFEKTTRRKEYFSSKEILLELKKVLASGIKTDFITFSGSGEPTLNTAISKLIREIKKMTSIPVAVLTNSSLLSRKEVRKALLAADVVVPSLDAASSEIFSITNRPHPSLGIEKIIDGLVKFRKEFRGAIWLEIMLVKGINDKPSHLRKLKEAIAAIKPDRVHLNTVVRPPAEKFAKPLSVKELEKIRNFLGENCEIIADFKRKKQAPLRENLEEAILSLIKRRPVTLQDISSSLGKRQKETKKYLECLLDERKIKIVMYRGAKYYEPES